jgi:hypothetical protein
MKLITELYDDVEMITESSDSGKKYTISGIFAQAEVGNRNGRIYKHSIMEREINSYVKNFVNENRALAEMNHPTHFHVNPDRVSHRITELKFDGNNVYGKANILNTPCGNIVKAFIDDGVKFGVSTRGIGTVKKNSSGLNEVQDDFKLSCIDIVTDPSAPDAFVQGILENKIFDIVDGVITESIIDNYKQVIKKSSTKELNEIKFKLFQDFMNNLKNK